MKWNITLNDKEKRKTLYTCEEIDLQIEIRGIRKSDGYPNSIKCGRYCIIYRLSDGLIYYRIDDQPFHSISELIEELNKLAEEFKFYKMDDNTSKETLSMMSEKFYKMKEVVCRI